jgi:serine/threonine protein kinase
VDDAGSIRLADFGCTAVSESTQGPTTTANGAVSDHWIAPEIIGSHAGAEFTDRTYESDIYSLASTIWEVSEIPGESRSRQILIMCSYLPTNCPWKIQRILGRGSGLVWSPKES